VIAPALVVLLAACERAPDAGTARAPDRAASRTAGAWSWDRYPQRDALVLSRAVARVAQRRTAPFVAPLDGRIEIIEPVRAAGTRGVDLPAGEVWARIAPAQLELERRTLDAQRRQIELRERLLDDLDEPRRLLEIRAELERARRTLEQLRLARDAGDDVLVRELFPDLPAGFGDDAVASAERLVELLERSERLAADPASNAERLGLELARVELEQAELAFERLTQRSELVMPFAGRLTLRPELDTEGPLFVRSGDVVASARGGATLLEVPAAESAWLDVPTDRLAYDVPLPGGGTARAPFDTRTTVELRGVETLIDRFAAPEDAAASLGSLSGATVRGRLVTVLPAPARVVPKIDLLLHAPEAFADADWAGGVASTWPGAVVVAVGLTEVAIARPVPEGRPLP
jgi:hypothetical protein